ncbi:MAG: hypothetical protein QXP44_02620 [Candidatus Bathyarchaeia archaeon]
MSTKKKRQTSEKVNLLDLTATKKVSFLKKAKEKLRQQMMEAKFLQSLLEIERLTINGYTIDFENGNPNGLTTAEFISF